MVNKPFAQQTIDKQPKPPTKDDLKRSVYKMFILEHLGLKTQVEIAAELKISTETVRNIIIEISSEHGTVHPLLISTVGEEQYNQLKEAKQVTRRNYLIAEQELQKAQKANSEWKPSAKAENPPYSDDDITLLKHRVNSDLGLFLAADGSLTKFLNAVGHYRPELKVNGNQPVIIQVNMVDMGDAIPDNDSDPMKPDKKPEREVNARGK